jgi:molybdenum cofactor biosynthesis enzyme
VTTIPRRTFIPALHMSIKKTCDFFTKHHDSIIFVVAIISPEDVTAVNNALTAVQAACVTITKIYDVYEAT